MKISIASLRAAGVPAELILVAMEMDSEDKRAKETTRKAQYRSRVSHMSRDVPPVPRDKEDKQDQRLGAEPAENDQYILSKEDSILVSKKEALRGKEVGSKRLGVAGGPFSFDQFWNAYPHKVGKGAAARAFDKARGKVTFAELLAGLERYKASKPVDRPWCNPATWLNERRWEDEPAELSAPSLSLVMPEHGNQHAGRVYLRRETPQFEAWVEHTGKAVTDKHGGWWFNSEWPPEMAESTGRIVRS